MNLGVPLKQNTVASICLGYGLGHPTSEAPPVAGGLIHRVYRVTTGRGAFAVKALDPNIMRRPGARAEFRRSERIASAFAAAGLPAVTALEGPEGTVNTFGDVTVLVFPWCEGSPLTKTAAGPPQARQIGAVLGRIHALDLRLPGDAPPRGAPPGLIPQAEWEGLVRTARERDIVWAAPVEAALPDLFLWARAAVRAAEELEARWVVSHCDLDQKNVLWRDEGAPALIDWESAGPARPAVDLMGAALDWSGQGAGPPERAAFASVLDGYRRHAEFAPEAALPALRCRLGDWLAWLGANMRRSLGEGISGRGDRSLGVRETAATLSTMYALAEGMEGWADWCRH